MRVRFLIAASAFLLAGHVSRAGAQGTVGQETALVETGARIARETCASCHSIGAGPEKKAVSAAPSFEAIAAMPSISELAIKVFLQTPHASMPNIMLAQAQINALAAYILSLRGK